MSPRYAFLCCAIILTFVSPHTSLLLRQSVTTPQTPAGQPSPPATLSMEDEQHHHLVFQNAYVKVFYVEIPAHDSTLYHRHDFPYVSLPPPPLTDAPPPPAASGGRPVLSGSGVSYALGGFSHTVNNTTDITLRNIAVELLRPQGNARNRCAEIVRGQALFNCVTLKKSTSSVDTLFGTDEISVDYWETYPNSTVTPANPQLSTLVGGLDGIVNVTANGDARMIPQAGLIWLLPGSKSTLETGRDSRGHFVAIVFKDSALQP